MQAPPEKLGSFYLGAEYDLAAGKRTETPINYDARDLTTHAICVGMTGSGKTGLCIDLLEEAALDRVPAILIDPKGDITNLLLQFPDLRAEDFQAWINEDDAHRQGKSVEEFAQSTAEDWRTGLADWGITPQRIRDLQATTDYTIFTPGSDAGIPINILGSLAVPPLAFDANAEIIREQISGTVAALLSLVGAQADPVRSREAILLSNIFEHFWRQGKDLDLAQLILAIQTPPVRQVGIFDVDTFYPQKNRFELAMNFNNLIAAPTFQSWLQGEALDVDQLFFTAEGKPRHSIFYLAHLSDSERMFFVTLLLENVLVWARRQTGTTSLRALLYFDELFGYFPPVAEPPSKRPLLTLLKQARAFGLGIVLVTQNPVDLDYKGLTNAGTWFIGKLQAERDKLRVVEGLKGALSAAGNSVEIDYDRLINGLSNRIFLMHNVHADRPVVFHTRWAQSYLRGPLTRPQVQQLMKERKAVRNMAQATAGAPTPAASTPPPVSPSTLKRAADTPAGFATTPPSLEPGVTQVYLPLAVDGAAAVRQLAKEHGQSLQPQRIQLVYEPAILGAAAIRFVDRKREIDQRLDQTLLVPVKDTVGGVDWADAELLSLPARDLLKQPEQVEPTQGPFFAVAPEQANSGRKLQGIRKALTDWLYYNGRLKIQVHAALGLAQHPDERERNFKIRLQQVARERRDAEVDKLEGQYSTQISRAQNKLRKQERKLTDDEAEHAARKQQELVGIGETMLGFFLGRRNMRGLSTAASHRRMTAHAGREIEASAAEIAQLEQEVAHLEQEIKDQTSAITLKWATLLDELTIEALAPRRTDIDVQLVALAWLPAWLIHYDDGLQLRTATIAAYQLPASA